jgi:hypothetical protein
MILFFESPGSTENLRNARIFNNKIGPDIGGPPIGGVSAHNTAGIFINHYNANQFTGAQIYNNLFRANPNESWNNKFITGQGQIYNNTFISGGGIGISVAFNSQVRNNLFYNVGLGINVGGNTAAQFAFDNNVYYGLTPGSAFYWNMPGPLQGMYSSLDQWKQLTGYDTNSVSAQPSLDANYVPTASDTVAKDKGVSFASLFTTDKLGVVRPQGPAWDIGAFEFASGAPTLPLRRLLRRRRLLLQKECGT